MPFVIHRATGHGRAAKGNRMYVALSGTYLEHCAVSEA